MKSIFGRYVLDDHYTYEYSCLPKDFIDLDNKVMTWHSDTIAEDTLKIQYDNQIMSINLIRTNSEDYTHPISVRIRTSGSSYGLYFEEFKTFFREITRVAENSQIQEESSQKLHTCEQQNVKRSKYVFC